MNHRVPQPWPAVFRVPALLAGLTLLGLFAALFGEAAAWRWTAWAAMGIPVMVIAWKLSAALIRMRERERNLHE